MAAPNETKRKALVQMVKDAWTHSSSALWDEMILIWDKLDNDFRCTFSADEEPETDSKIFLPDQHKAVRAFLSRAYFSFFTDQPPLSVIPYTARNAEQARVIEAACNRDITMRFNQTEIYQAFEDVSICGSNFVYVGWTNSGPNGIGHAKVTRLRPHDVRADPNAVKWQDARYCIVRRWMTWNEVWTLEQNGVFYRGSAKALEGMDDTARRDARDNEMAWGYNQSSSGLPKELNLVEVWDYWGLADTGNGFELSIVSIAPNYDTFLQARKLTDYHKHGRIPVECGAIIPSTDSYLGISPLWPGRQTFLATVNLANLIMDSQILSRAPMYLVSKSERLMQSKLRAKPGAFLQVADLDSIRPFPMSSVQPDSQFMTFLQTSLQSITGAYSVLTGEFGPRREPATTSMALKDVAELQQRMMIKALDQTSMNPIADAIKDAVLANITDNELILKAPDGVTLERVRINRDDLYIDCETRTIWTGMESGLSREAKVDKVMKLLTLVVQNAQAMGMIAPLVSEIAELLGIKNLSEKINIPGLAAQGMQAEQTPSPSPEDGGGIGAAAVQPNVNDPLMAAAEAGQAGGTPGVYAGDPRQVVAGLQR